MCSRRARCEERVGLTEEAADFEMSASMLRALAVSVAACAWLVACGDGGEEAMGFADAREPRRLFEDAAADGGDAAGRDVFVELDADGGDAAVVGDGGDGGGGGLVEAEGIDEQVNDAFESAEVLPVGATVRGTIGNIVDGAYDLDVYRFDANAGEVFRVTLRPQLDSLFDPSFDVVDESGDYQRVGIDVREVYAIATGPLAVVVGDLRNAEDPPQNAGGAELTYTLTVERVTPSIVRLMTPVNRMPAPIDANGAIHVYELELAAGDTLTAETFASRLGTPSDVDTILLLEDPRAHAILASNDDLDFELEIIDSAIEAPIAAAGTYRLILDFFDIYGPDRSVELDVRNAAGPMPEPGALVINEVDYDQIGADNAEMIELYNAGAGDVALDSLALIFVNGLNDSEYRRVELDLAGPTLAAGDYLVIAMDGVAVAPSALVIRDNNTTQNGAPDGLLLFDTATETVLDALSYEGEITAASITGVTAAIDLVEGTAATAADGDATNGALARCPDGTDTGDADIDWTFRETITAGAANNCP